MQKEKFTYDSLDVIVYNQKEDNVLEEALSNWHYQDIDIKDIEKITIKDIKKFLEGIEKLAQKKINSLNHSMYFYSWIDIQDLSINYSFISSIYEKLPFESNHIIMEDIKIIAEIFFYELRKASAEINLRRFFNLGKVITLKNQNLDKCNLEYYFYVYKKILNPLS
jgi:hypothetical protein